MIDSRASRVELQVVELAHTKKIIEYLVDIFIHHCSSSSELFEAR